MSGRYGNAIRVVGFAATPLFALYNGVLGVWYASLWHGSICIYYLLLSLLRGLLLVEARARGGGSRTASPKERQIFRLTSGVLLLMNASLVVPVSLMVLDQRPVRLGMIPAITTATYTTYKLVAASVKLKRHRSGPFTRQLSRLGFVDALVSILVLQNTLIIAVDGAVSQKMFLLSAITSAAILLVILVLSVFWVLRGTGKSRGGKFTP